MTEISQDPQFIHLRVHSDFSMIDGLAKVKPICDAAVSKGMPALALTDQMNLCGLVRFYRATHEKGLKPIIGCDLWVLPEGWNSDSSEQPFRLTALAMNNEGYQQLTQLISRGYLAGHRCGKPCVNKEWLADHQQGLLLLSGATEGDVGRKLLQNRTDEAEQLLAFYQRHFPDRFYLELLRTGRPGEDEYLHAAVAL